MPQFPLTPGYRAGLARGAPRRLRIGQSFITYRKGNTVTLELTVNPLRDAHDSMPSSGARSVPIGVADGLIDHVVVGDSDPQWTVLWPLDTGEWAHLTGRLTEAETLRYARALTRAPLPVDEPFRFALVPEGFAPGKVTRPAWS